jgi:molybdopterin converting factor small subunit
MPENPLDDYLATLRAATRTQTSELEAGELMDAIRQALDDTRWQEQQHHE